MTQTLDTRRQAQPEVSARPRLVAVEDEPDFRFLLREWLAREYDLILLPTGEELIDEIPELQPDIVLMDIGLPGPDGVLLTQRLREDPKTAETPVLFLTGKQDDETFVRALAAGGALLTKPVRPADLRDKLRELLDQP